MARDRFKKLTDLFVQGKHVRLPDGTYLWVQVLNTYERDECLSAAQVARARLVMALRNDTDERAKVNGHIAEVGYPAIVRELAESAVDDSLFKIISSIRDDPDWRERVEVMDNTDLNDLTRELRPSELVLLEKIQREFIDEIEVRKQDALELAMLEFQGMEDEELDEEYLKQFLDKRGGEAAAIEYALREVVLATRYSDVTENEDGELDTSSGLSRGERVFESVADVREMPQELVDLIRQTLAKMDMSERDPKGLGSPQASSGSSPSPSEPAESTASTSIEAQPEPHGSSSQLSPTP